MVGYTSIAPQAFAGNKIAEITATSTKNGLPPKEHRMILNFPRRAPISRPERFAAFLAPAEHGAVQNAPAWPAPDDLATAAEQAALDRPGRCGVYANPLTPRR